MDILAAGLVFATAYLLGLSLLLRLRLKLTPVITSAAALIMGTLTLTQIIFWQSYLVKFSAPAILTTMIIIIITCFWYLKPRVTPVKIKFNWGWLVWISGWLVLWLVIWGQMLKTEPDGLYAGWVNIWGDWAAHLTYTTSFAYGDNFPPQMPILSGAKFSYPFMADFLSAILIKLGSNLIPALLLPSVILSTVLVVLLTGLGQAIGKNFSAGKITALLFLFNGGFGWWWWLKDIGERGLIPTLNNLPREYTHLEKLANIEWINIITSQVIPQRGFLLGFPAAVLIYLFFWSYWQKRQRPYLLAAGLTTGLLPLVHAHSLAIIAAVGTVLFLLRPGKHWLWFFLPLIFLALPAMLYFYWPSVNDGGFIKWFPGWLALSRGDRLGWFWLKNLGLMTFLPLLGLKLANGKLRRFSLPFWLIFISANLWLFQPWEWDNTKFFVHWYLLASVLAAVFLARVPRLLAIIVIIITIWAGLLDVWRLTQYPFRRLKFWNNDQLQLADWVKTNTAPSARFLTAGNHDHWLPTLTGRKILIGFNGWLWTYGINYSAQEQAARIIFGGQPEALDKIAAYGLDYAVIGPLERQIKPAINESWFRENFSLVYSSGSTQIYSLSD